MRVYEKNLIGELTGTYTPVALPINEFTVEVDVDVEQGDFESMKNYSTFLADANQAIQDRVIAVVIADTGKLLGPIDRAYYAAKTLGLDKEARKWDDAAKLLLRQATEKIRAGCEKTLAEEWQRVLQIEKNARKAKIKATIHIVLNCVAISLAIVALASTPVNPAGPVAAGITLVAGVGSLVKNFRDLCVKLPKLDKEIAANFVKYKKKAEELQKKLDEEEKKAGKEAKLKNMKAKEGGKVAVSMLTGGVSDLIISKLGKALPSLDALGSDVDLMSTKIDSLDASQRGLSEKLNDLLDKSSLLTAHYELLERQFNEYLTDLSAKGAKCPPKVLDAQAKIVMPKKRKVMTYSKVVEVTLKKIETVRGAVKTYRDNHAEYADKVKKLKEIHKTEKVALFTKIVTVLAVVAVGAGGSGWEKTGDIIANVYSSGATIYDGVASDLVIDHIR